ncbi:MAG: DUF2975 domain-containing protein [bacterium]|nr:DUF2975 domain-containing protein [bacterium]
MTKPSTIFLQITIVLAAIGALAFLIWEPRMEGVNAHATNWEMYSDPFILLVYAGSLPFFYALYQAFKLLGHVRQDRVFTLNSAKALRTIKYCAFSIIGFVIVEEITIMLNHGDDDAAGAMMLGVMIIFCSIVVAVVANMFEKLVQNTIAASPAGLQKP